MHAAQLNNIFGSLAQRTGPQVSPLAFLMLMAISLVCSLFIAYLYVHFYASRATGSQVHRSFPLLGISITAIFISIQFSLLFRLVFLGAVDRAIQDAIKEPEEIGFIMLVIATSLAVATFKLGFVGVILLVALAALFGQVLARRFMSSEGDGTIVISLSSPGRTVDPSAITASASQAALQGDARKRFVQRARKPLCHITFKGLPIRRCRACRPSLTRRGALDVQRVLQQAGRILDAAPPHRMPWWLLIVATAVDRSGVGGIEAADWFPLWRFAVHWSRRRFQVRTRFRARKWPPGAHPFPDARRRPT
jgi:hypothetical protein